MQDGVQLALLSIFAFYHYFLFLDDQRQSLLRSLQLALWSQRCCQKCETAHQHKDAKRQANTGIHTFSARPHFVIDRVLRCLGSTVFLLTQLKIGLLSDRLVNAL